MERKTTPIVVLGASAGGLEAFEKFFLSTPPTSGFAYVVLAHLSPNHISILPQLLQRKTEMKVVSINSGIIIKPNSVYVIPPNKILNIKGQNLFLNKIDPNHRIILPIDNFFLELAKNYKNNVACIILSGTGTDGTIGLKEIKKTGGLTIAQDPKSCKYDGMPNNAISCGIVDYVLPPEKMYEKLKDYFENGIITIQTKPTLLIENKLDALQQIYILLYSETGHDFSHYKENTILRRIERRMSLNQISNIKDYANFLSKNNSETKTLFKEILIGVTNFFRDPIAFEILGETVLPDLLAEKKAGDTIRVWIPACSTGEEAYSIAILFREITESLGKVFDIKIFSTDIDNNAVEFARIGRYSASTVSEISKERLNKYFTKEDDGSYKISKLIREMVVLAEQNVIKDPPFASLDFISCRNLLIYLDQHLQRKLIETFHYSLKPEGMLFLGTSETLGSAVDLFGITNNKWKIFNRLHLSRKKTAGLNFIQSSVAVNTLKKQVVKMNENPNEIDQLMLVEQILKLSNNPPCVIIDHDGKIQYIHGKVSRFLDPPSGRPIMNILDMARTGLKIKLSSAITEVITNKTPIGIKEIKVNSNGGYINVNLSVKPFLIPKYRSNLLLVLFEESKSRKNKKNDSLSKNEFIENEDLKEELAFTTEKLQITIEELQSSNEELKSSNEELQSINEELQSSNEELETSKEELQSMNEESVTVNNELQSRMESLALSNDDLKNLMDSTSIAVIFLDLSLQIRRFTASTTEIVPLKIGDEGRHITDFSSVLIDFDIEQESKQVLDDLSARNWEVNTTTGKFYYIKIRPYRTTKNVIDGVVITLEDITNLKSAEKMARLAVVLKDSNDAISLISSDGSILEWNLGAEKLYGYSESEASKKNFKDLIASKSKTEQNKIFKQIISSKNSKIIKSKRFKKNGKELEVLTTISSIWDKTSKSNLFAITEMEITKVEKVIKT